MILGIVGLWAVIYVPGLFLPPLLDDADGVTPKPPRDARTP